MTAQVITMERGRPGVRAPLRDWHTAGRFLHFQGGDGKPVDLPCGSPGEAERLAHYVNDRIQAARRLAAARNQEPTP